jgi:hypothetical protein
MPIKRDIESLNKRIPASDNGLSLFEQTDPFGWAAWACAYQLGRRDDPPPRPPPPTGRLLEEKYGGDLERWRDEIETEWAKMKHWHDAWVGDREYALQWWAAWREYEKAHPDQSEEWLPAWNAYIAEYVNRSNDVSK